MAPSWRRLLYICVALLLVVGVGVALYRYGQSAADQPPNSRDALQPTAHVPEQWAVQPVATAAPTFTLPATPVSRQVLASTGGPTSDNTSVSIISTSIVTTVRVASATGKAPADGSSFGPALSLDGRFVAFTSKADNLVANDHNGYDDLFIVDRQSGDVRLVSQSVDGQPGNGWSRGAALSGAGQVVAFYSWANDLVAGDTNAVQDLFVRDLQTGSTRRASVASDGAQANDRSGDSELTTRPAISLDGAIVAFHSRAGNLVEQDDNRAEDIFVHDLRAGETQRVSISTEGRQANGDSRSPSLSADGRLVAFESDATNLTLGASAGAQATQIYFHNRESGETRLISAAPTGLPGNGASRHPMLSADGRFIVFESAADNLASNDGNQGQDIFVHELATGETTLVSVSSAGAPGNRDSFLPAISIDGRHVAFVSEATNLVNGDGNAAADIFVHDRQSRHTGRVSLFVLAPQKGLEADGASSGPPSLSIGGRLVAFASAAANLTQQTDNAVGEIFVHERRDPTVHSVDGRVLDWTNAPLAGVKIQAGPHLATTDADGRFTLPGLTGGAYALAPQKEGYSFAPERRLVSVPYSSGSQEFRAFPERGSERGFLDLPFGYDDSVATFTQALQDTDDGGWVDAWFDHAHPDYAKDRQVLLWDGRVRSDGAYNPDLGCYERRCYDGHDGVDFPYRDPDPATPAYEPMLIYPVADGVVVAMYTGCASGDRTCNDGYGNDIVLDHGNGYYSRYAHLAGLMAGLRGALGASVGRGDALGLMGSTGNSQGAHLHLAIHRDNGNGFWDGDKVDLAVDPFGWAQGGPDPWVADKGGPASRWLWRYTPTQQAFFLGSRGAIIRDASATIEVTVPPGAFEGQVKLELARAAPPYTVDGAQRSLGQSFSLRTLEWLDGGEQQARAYASGAPDSLPLPLALGITTQYGGADMRHFDLGQLALHWWDGEANAWLRLPTVIDDAQAMASAASDRLGDYDLQAPLLCPEDNLEPDDDYFAANQIEVGGDGVTRLFDVDEDQDWFRLEADAGRQYRILATGANSPRLALFDVDGLSRLADGKANGADVELVWGAPAAGTYFVRLAPGLGDQSGCDARYTMRVE